LSGTLIVWKAPLVDDADAARALLDDFYETGDESAFEASPDVARFYDEIVALDPVDDWDEGRDEDETPTWAGTPERSDRVVSLDYSWSAPRRVPRGPSACGGRARARALRPAGAGRSRPRRHQGAGPPDLREIVRVGAIGLGAAAVAVGAWLVSVPILSWVEALGS